MKSAWKLGWVILAALLIASPLQSAETTTVPAAASAPTATSQAAKEGIAVIRMAGEVQESPPQFSLFEDPATAMTLRDWLQRLAKARNDKSIKAVLLEVDGLALSWAQAQELSDAVHRLAEVKPVYACVVEVGTSQYLVASGATLKANGLAEVERIADITSRLIINRAALKTRPDELTGWIEKFREAIDGA